MNPQVSPVLTRSEGSGNPDQRKEGEKVRWGQCEGHARSSGVSKKVRWGEERSSDRKEVR